MLDIQADSESGMKSSEQLWMSCYHYFIKLKGGLTLSQITLIFKYKSQMNPNSH